MLSEHKRVKHGELPGDISRRAKIKLREKRTFLLFPWQFMGKAVGKAFRKILAEKGRTVQRRRDKRAIKSGLEIGDLDNARLHGDANHRRETSP